MEGNQPIIYRFIHPLSVNHGFLTPICWSATGPPQCMNICKILPGEVVEYLASSLDPEKAKSIFYFRVIDWEIMFRRRSLSVFLPHQNTQSDNLTSDKKPSMSIWFNIQLAITIWKKKTSLGNMPRIVNYQHEAPTKTFHYTVVW